MILSSRLRWVFGSRQKNRIQGRTAGTAGPTECNEALPCLCVLTFMSHPSVDTLIFSLFSVSMTKWEITAYICPLTFEFLLSFSLSKKKKRLPHPILISSKLVLFRCAS